jgi:hypothetical protein
VPGQRRLDDERLYLRGAVRNGERPRLVVAPLPPGLGRQSLATADLQSLGRGAGPTCRSRRGPASTSFPREPLSAALNTTVSSKVTPGVREDWRATIASHPRPLMRCLTSAWRSHSVRLTCPD